MNAENLNNPVADNISSIIKGKGLKQCAVAEKAGYTKHELNHMLKGRKLMKQGDVVRLKKVLDVSYDELYEERE